MYDIPYVSDAIRILIFVLLGLAVFFIPGLDGGTRLIVIALFVLLTGLAIWYRRSSQEE